MYALDACHGDVAVQFRRLEVSRAITPLYGSHANASTKFCGVLLKLPFREFSDAWLIGFSHFCGIKNDSLKGNVVIFLV